MKKQLLLLVMMLLSMVTSADNVTFDIAVENADGVIIYYSYINNGTELEVTRAFNKGTIVIPEEVTYMNRTRKVTSIGNQAFSYSYNSLTSVTIPNSVTYIGKEAFYYCSGLTSVTIPNNVTYIGEKAFAYCSGLSSVTIGSSVSTIGKDAFDMCQKLTSVNIYDVAAWCNIKFKSGYTDFYEGSNPLNYAHRLYLNGEELKDLIIPSSVTSIGDGAFQQCYSLTSVTIPNSVITIGKYAFDRCHLTSLVLSNSVTTIGSAAFYGCGLNQITIPNSVTSIERGAFSGWDLPVVISLIENPFKIYGKADEYNRTFSQNTFNNATLYVPAGTIDKYKATNGWKDFLFIEEGTGGGGTTPEKCAKPTISYNKGKLIYHCETEGATCQYNIMDNDIKTGCGKEVQLAVTYNISVYAIKAGYENSETATATLCWIDQQPKTEGITNGIANIPANAVLIQSEGGILKVEGIDDGAQVSVYTPDGKQAGSAVCRNGAALVGTNIQPGNTAIVKIGEKAVKVIVK